MRFNLIGAGRLGKNLALALVNSGSAQLAAVCNSNFHQAELAVEQIGAGFSIASLYELPRADLIFITVPDDTIPKIVNQLMQDEAIAPQTIVVHCSGVLNSTELNPLKELGCHIASLHPSKAFRTGKLDEFAFKDCNCAIEGDQAALEVLIPLFKLLEANLIPIKAEGKAVYHAAAVMASNYLVTLAASAIDLQTEAGIPPLLAQQITAGLMQSSLDNIQQVNKIAEALTGPLLRGDVQTIQKHLQVLTNSKIDTLYRSAGLATLPITGLDEEKQLELSSVLTL